MVDMVDKYIKKSNKLYPDISAKETEISYGNDSEKVKISLYKSITGKNKLCVWYTKEQVTTVGFIHADNDPNNNVLARMREMVEKVLS